MNDNQTNLKGAVFHFKAYAIFLFICGGLLCLLGLPLLLLFGLGIIYIGMGILYVFLGLNILKASQSVKKIIEVSELTQDEYNSNSMNVILEIKKHFKILNIIVAVSLALGLILGIAFASALPAFYKQLEKENFTMNSQNYNSKLPRITNPYQSQVNNSPSATQMGMSDEEHASMHDPKNIADTDYSSLDYTKPINQSKNYQEEIKKAMETLTPEQKTVMEKAMSNIKN